MKRNIRPAPQYDSNSQVRDKWNHVAYRHRTYFTYRPYYYPFDYYPYYESVYRGLHNTVYAPSRTYEGPQ